MSHYLAPRYWTTSLILGFMRASVYLPFWLQLKLGSLIGFCFYWLTPARRRIAKTNLALCFPNLSEQARTQILKKCFCNLGIGILETGFSWWASEQRLKNLYTLEGLEHIRQAQQTQRPILLLSAHTLSIGMGARCLAIHLPFQALYKRARNRLFETAMLRARSRWYAELIDRKETKRLLRGMKKGLATWYAPDQNFGREEIVFAPFFGVPAATLTATARIARMTHAVVIPFFTYRNPNGLGYRLVLEKPLENFPTDDTLADATYINHIIENAIQQAPEQYMWVHKRFRTRPAGEPPIY